MRVKGLCPTGSGVWAAVWVKTAKFVEEGETFSDERNNPLKKVKSRKILTNV